MEVVVQKTVLGGNHRLPLIAALPFRIQAQDSPSHFEYDPISQRSVCGRDYSTCRVDESVGVFSSKSDTQKDD